MYGVVIIGAAALIQDPGPVVDAEEFLRLIQGVHADYKDVAFVYEGTYTELSSVLAVPTSEKVKSSFQGYFAYRSDGAFLRDSFTRSLENNDEGAVFRKIDAALGGRMTRIDYMLDHRTSQPQEGEASPHILREYASPGRLFWTWYFQLLDDLDGLHYQFQGWEEVDGHRCLRVELDRDRGSESWKYRFWIDIERGGHPLKVEQVEDGEVILRTEEIKLQRLPTDDGKELWLPVQGHTLQLVDASPSTPGLQMVRDACSVAFGTARINSGLGDEVFSIDWEGPLPSNPELDKLRAEADEPFVIRLDAQSVRDDLDRMLAEADAQSDRLEASALPPWWRRPGTVAPIGFALLGVVLLIGAAIRKGVLG